MSIRFIGRERDTQKCQHGIDDRPGQPTDLFEHPQLGRGQFCTEFQTVIAHGFDRAETQPEAKRIELFQGNRRPAGEFLGDARLRPFDHVRQFLLTHFLAGQLVAEALAHTVGQIHRGYRSA